MSATEHGATAGVMADLGLLDLAARRVEAGTGLAFAGVRRRQFDTALGRMAAALGLPDTGACAAWLLAAPWDDARSALCARFLTIGETYFFREPRALDLVCDVARAHLAHGARRPLRIWSAGCCTGEEPYSIALALRRRVPGLAPDRVEILATDLNEAFLDVARAGVYRRWSFRRGDPAGLADLVRPLGDGRFEIDQGVRGQVRFAGLNLATDTYPSAATGTLGLDVVFCRNVLMYFGREQASRVVARLRACLVDGGWLVVNASEASPQLFPGFTPVFHADAVFFRKGAPAAAEAPCDPAPAAPAIAAAAHPSAHPSTHPSIPPPMPVAPAVNAPAVDAPAVPAAVQAAAPAPGDALAHVHALARAGRREDALRCLRRAVEAGATAAPLQRDAALFALEYGDRALARLCVRRLLYLEPDSALGHYLSALLEDAAGRPAHARSLLRDCRRLAGGDASRGAVGQWLEHLS